MNIRILSIASLLLVANFINGSEKKQQYEMKYNEVKKNKKQATHTLYEELEILYKKDRGYHWAVEIEMQDPDYADLTSIKNKYSNKALRELQEIPTQYNKFLYLIKNYAYYAALENGLKLILETNDSFNSAPSITNEDLIKKYKAYILNRTFKYDDARYLPSRIAEFEVNTIEDQERALNDLYSIIKEIEANNLQ